MPKRVTAFELALPPRDSETPAYRWLYASLRAEILEGRLRSGAKLPATRDLALQYGLSRGTIVSAFELLKSEGYLRGTIGSGTYVSKVLPETLLHVKRELGAVPNLQRKKHSRLSDYARRVNLFSGFEIRPSRAFRPNVPALDLFPTALWAQITVRRWRSASMQFLLGCNPMGYAPLRDAVANYLSTSRGVKCNPEQIAIVSGVQEALDLTARIFLNPGDRVSMENPGYPGARMAFEAVGAKVSAVRLDDDGMKVRSKGLQSSRLVYVTPGHEFPLGITMSLSRRLELLEWARKSGALIFEDDYDSEYRFAGRPIPAMQGFDRSGSVIFAGSFSKVLFPSLRLGYLVIPPDLMTRYEATISLTTRHAPLPQQAVLCDFITEGHLGRHLRRMREVYAERLSILLDSAREKLAGLLEISEIEAGLQTVGWLCEGINGESATRAAAARGVEVFPLSRYTRGKVEREGLQLGFAAVDAREIRRGVQDLAIALEAESNT
ncbi:MAG: PLP-dependent aminotransferase family protein [Candidatus Acidiferrales bacterium]